MQNRTDTLPAIGRTITFLLAPTGAHLTWGSIGAALCGAVASNGWQWQGERLLALLQVLFLVEGLWSTWRALLIDIDWQGLAQTYPLPPQSGNLPAWPYLTPWSPLGQIIARWGRLRRWACEILPPNQGNALMTLPYLPAIILIVSALLGHAYLLLSSLVIALTIIEWFIARRQPWHKSMQAIVQIALSWIAGHLVFAPLTTSSLTLACAYALSYQGALYLHDERCTAQEYPWALGLLFGGQIFVAGALAGHDLLIAVLLGLLLSPQLALVPHLAPSAAPGRYLRHLAPFVSVAMLVAAWAI